MATFQNVGQLAQTPRKNDATNGNTIPGNTADESLTQDDMQASPATGFDSKFNDSGICDCEDVETAVQRHDYNDFDLYTGPFPDSNGDSLFADLDASTKANHGSIYNGSNNESTSYIERGTVNESTEQRHRTSSYDPVHGVVQEAIDQSIIEAINDFDIRSQPDYSRPSQDSLVISPLDKWANTYERHESIAYRFEQPPTPRQSPHDFRQPSHWPGNEARYH